MNVMLDTDSCIYLINRDPDMTPQEPMDECAISTIVLGELEWGISNAAPARQEANRGRLYGFLSTVTVLDVDAAVAQQYAVVRDSVRNQPIGVNDRWIAAHALAMQLPLVTNNTNEFSRVAGLALQNWMGPG